MTLDEDQSPHASLFRFPACSTLKDTCMKGNKNSLWRSGHGGVQEPM